MKIVNQGHKILKCPTAALADIEQVSKTCYQSGDGITPMSAPDHVRMLLSRSHDAMIEFGDIWVQFTTSRVQSQSLVRHRHCSFAQESTRYVKYKNGDMEFIRPHKLIQWDRPSVAWKVAMEDSENKYAFLLQHGWKAQDARGVLPLDLKTEIVMKTNIRDWRNIFGLRCANAAHPQMVSLMRPLLTELKDRVPVVFDDLYKKFCTGEKK